MGMLCISKSAFSIQEYPIMISNWATQSKQLIFSIQLVRRINASEMIESPDAYLYQYRTHNNTTCGTTPHDNIGDAVLAAVTSAAARLENTGYIHPYLRPSAARDSTRWPQAVSRTFCQLLRWLELWQLSKKPSVLMTSRTRWGRTARV